MNKLLGLLALLSLAGCAGLSKYQLKNDYYEFHQPGQPSTKVFVRVKEDSIEVTKLNESTEVVRGQDEYFIKKSFDIDAMVVPFKYRPSSMGFPRQLNTSFNGNVYIGYRIDRFWLDYKNTPAGMVKELKHSAITVGGFGGLGTAFISPWSTNYQTTDEYDGVVLTRGLALMVGINSLTVGLGVGWDYLTDRDKDIWIYQNKAWYGLTLGLNIN
ncbi:MAG TPA: hypothetical protein PL167_13025 [Cyclobacteriaceae bacterium]|nr:hypothetical protein [Cyclobacteriaceae bacterium]